MQQTTKYALNQWDASDRILRADFNRDNERVEAAVTAVDARLSALEGKSGLKLLRTVTTTETARIVSFVLTDVPWNSCQKIHLEVVPYTVTRTTVSVNLNTPNNHQMGNVEGNTAIGGPNSRWCIFFPMYDARRTITMLNTGYNDPRFTCMSTPYTDISAIYVSCSDAQQLYPGTICRIYGEA